MYKSILSAAALATFATTALAHVTLEQGEAVIGQTAKITLRVPHGCDGQATHTVRLSLPDGFYAAQPMPKAGWTLTLKTGPYAVPYSNHGTEMREGLREVIWSGGDLQSDWYDEFTVRGTFGANLAPGTVMYFPAVQDCDSASADWSDTSGAKGVPNPAPKLTLVAGAAGHDAHAGHGMDMPMMAATTVGDLAISGGFARATLPNAPVGGGFLSVANHGTADDRLVSASSPLAGRVEIHEMAMQGDVMKMRALADGLPIPAGATVDLTPGGYHLMFMDLNTRFLQGGTVPVTLHFEKAGSLDMLLPIGAPNAKSADQK